MNIESDLPIEYIEPSLSKGENQGPINRQLNAIRALAVTQHAATLRRPVTYSELAKVLDTFPGSGVMNRALYDMVQNNKIYEIPFFSSLVVSEVTNQPGDGFFSACHEFGARYKDRAQFVLSQQVACFKYMAGGKS